MLQQLMDEWHQKQLDLTYKWAPNGRTNICKITITASHLAMETITIAFKIQGLGKKLLFLV